jgi:hypothetical protein
MRKTPQLGLRPAQHTAWTMLCISTHALPTIKGLVMAWAMSGLEARWNTTSWPSTAAVRLGVRDVQPVQISGKKIHAAGREIVEDHNLFGARSPQKLFYRIASNETGAADKCSHSSLL